MSTVFFIESLELFLFLGCEVILGAFVRPAARFAWFEVIPFSLLSLCQVLPH
jgi:hypothetical protein